MLEFAGVSCRYGPVAGLVAADLPVLLDRLRRLRAEVTVLLVADHMDVVARVADQVTVMHHGKVLAPRHNG